MSIDREKQNLPASHSQHHLHHREVLIVPDGGAPVVLPGDLDFESETPPPRLPREELMRLQEHPDIDIAEIILPAAHIDARFVDLLLWLVLHAHRLCSGTERPS
jgi:hypothetical protein